MLFSKGSFGTCKCNLLQTLYPELASQWDFVKNEGTSDDYTSHSTHLAWWTTPKCKSWQQSIKCRAVGVDHEKKRALIKVAGV